MPPRPFPLPYRTGVDICHVHRFSHYFSPTAGQNEGKRWQSMSLDQRKRQLFVLFNKVFTEPEQRQFWARMPAYETIYQKADVQRQCATIIGGRQATHISVRSISSDTITRWAAKEAVIKATRHSKERSHYMLDVEIHRTASGRPFAILLDQRRKHRSAEDIYYECHPRATKLEPSSMHDTQLNSPESEVQGKPQPSSIQPLDLSDTEGQVIDISISHDGAYCVATAIAPKDPLPGDVGGEAAARDFSY